MHRSNFESTLRTLIQRQPFRPFVVELVSGSQVQADHREALVAHGGVAVYLAPGGTPAIFDEQRVSQITAR